MELYSASGIGTSNGESNGKQHEEMEGGDWDSSILVTLVLVAYRWQ